MKEGPCIAGMKLGLLNKDYKLVVVVTDNNLKSMEQHFKIKNSVFFVWELETQLDQIG